MPGQIEQLFRQVSGTLAATSAKIEEVLVRQRKLDESRAELLERIVELEATSAEREKWTGEERRKVDERLGSGDHTLEAMRAQITEADRIAREALKLAGQAAKSAGNAWKALQPLLTGRPETTIRKKWKDALIEYGIKTAIGLFMLGLYHVLVHGPAIARAIQAAHRGGGE